MGDQDVPELSELDDETPQSEETKEPGAEPETIEVPNVGTAQDLEAVYDIPVQVSAVLGKSTMEVNQLL